jgi:hypothetical protein
MIRPITLCALAGMLAGCAATQASAPPAVDTFCITAKKRTWSVHDTAETIRDAEAWNKTIDLRCGVRGKRA